MITILGAGGAIGNELVRLLAATNQAFRVVGRHPKATPGATEILAADLMDKDQTIRAVSGSSVVHLLVGLKYDRTVWEDMWPGVMSNAIEACKRAGAKLLFFDNVYMYGRVNGPMTEETPFNPCSRKGEIRAKIATTLINEWKAGALTAMIARSADFYGPDTRNAVPSLLVFEPLAKKRKASWLVNDAVPHAFTYTPDAAQSLLLPRRTADCLESDLARPHRSPSADRQRIHRPGREGIGRRTETSCAEPADAPVADSRSARGRILRDALPERGAVPVRLQQIRQGVRFRGNPVRRGITGAATSFKDREPTSSSMAAWESQAHGLSRVKRARHGPRWLVGAASSSGCR